MPLHSLPWMLEAALTLKYKAKVFEILEMKQIFSLL